MANELQGETPITTGTIYCRLRNTVGQRWNTSGTPAFENYNAANIANYAITATLQSDGTAVADMPGTVGVGLYYFAFYQRLGASAAVTDPCISSGGFIDWTGSVASAAIAYLPQAQAGAANGVLISGSNAGTTTFGALTVTGAVAFQSTFAVTTSTSLAALSCSTLTASGAVAFQSTLAITGATTFSGTVTFNSFTVTNATTLSTLTTTGSVQIGSVSGSLTIRALTVDNATTLTGAVSLGSTLSVTGTTTFAAINTGAIGTGNVTITGTLSTSGTVTFNAFTVTNAFTVSGATTLTGAVTATNAGNNITGVHITGTPDVNLATWLGVAPLALSSQQVQAIVPDTQKVDVNTIKTNPVVNGGTITFPTNATLASTTNITAGTITTVSGNVTGNVGGNVTGSVGSVVAAVTVGTNNDKTGYTLSTAGLAAFFTTDTTKTFADAVAGSVVYETATNANTSGVAAAVWAYATRTLSAFAFTPYVILADNVAHGGPGASLELSSVAVDGATTLTGAVHLVESLTIDGLTTLGTVLTGQVSLDALSVFGLVQFDSLTVDGVTTLSGAVTATDAANDIRGVHVTGTPDVNLATWLGVAPLALSSQQVQAVVPSSTVVASVTGNVGGSVGSVTAPVTVGTNNDKSGYALSALGIDAIFAQAMTDGGYTFQQWLTAVGAAVTGKSSGNPGSPVYKGMNSNTTRLTTVCDDDGNRTSVTISV